MEGRKGREGKHPGYYFFWLSGYGCKRDLPLLTHKATASRLKAASN